MRHPRSGYHAAVVRGASMLMLPQSDAVGYVRGSTARRSLPRWWPPSGILLTLLRIPIAIIVTVGLLIVPVECSLAAGPHSIFQSAAALATLQTAHAHGQAARAGHHPGQTAEPTSSPATAGFAGGRDPSQSDMPTVKEANAVGVGLALLAALLATMMLPPPIAERVWPRVARWRGRLPVLEPPPPRLSYL